MLDVQRNRGNPLLHEVIFTRKLMWVHMIAGAAVIALLLFHELFGWFGAALAWYLVTLGAMVGFMNEFRWCQWILAALFAAIAATGIYFTNSVFPSLTPPKAPLVPHSLLPIWVGMANLAYGVGCLLMLFSSKVRRAGLVGFTLW